MMRATVALVIVALACLASYRLSAHHEGDGPFQTLYMHLMPAALVHDQHPPAGEELRPLLDFPLPGLPSIVDWRGQAELGEAPRGALFNLQVFQVAAVLLIFVLFGGVPAYLRTGKGDRLTRIFAGFAGWVRDEMVIPVMGKELGNRFLPYFLSIFFFILFMNVIGLMPGSATATANVFVTGALALTTLIAMIGCGMVVQGPVAFWLSLVPAVPWWLWPLMFVVEVFGLFMKPFALMIRLFANMTGGHLVVLSFMGIFFFLAQLWGPAGGWASAPVGVGFAVFIMIIESFIALVQAYVFTQLSIIFVNASVHPEH